MRIVSWNKQHVNLHPMEFAEMLRLADADVVVLQEPSGNPMAAGWTFVPINGQGNQDNYAIGVREEGSIKYSMMFPDPRGHKAENARSWVVARVTLNGETITIATCHAPHIGGKHTESSHDTIEYMNALARSLGMPFKRPPSYIATTKRKEKEGHPNRDPQKDPHKPVVADLFIGDTNLYEPQAAGGDAWLPDGWRSAHVGCTTGHRSGKAGGSPLDRIAFRTSSKAFKANQIACGRIKAADTAVGGTPAKDLVIPPSKAVYQKKPDAAALWTKADHLAIYFDTGPRPTGEGGADREKMDGRVEPMDVSPPPSPQGAGMRLRYRQLEAPPPEKKGRTSNE